MSSIDNLHSEIELLQVEDHMNLLSAQYLVHCLDKVNVCHHITMMEHPAREMKETIITRHNQTMLPLLASPLVYSPFSARVDFPLITLPFQSRSVNEEYWSSVLRPDALPGVNQMYGMPYQIVLNIIVWLELN